MPTVRFRHIAFDLVTRKLFCDNQEVQLGTKAKALLVMLIDGRDTRISYAQVINALWPPEKQRRVINRDVHDLVKQIRSAVREIPEILNVKTVGYCFVTPPDFSLHAPESRGVNDIEPHDVPPFEQAPQIELTPTQQAAAARLEELRHAYRLAVPELDYNLGLQFLLVVSAAAMTSWLSDVAQPAKFIVPVCIGLAAALAYLWLRFGFKLDDLIEWRSEAWSVLVQAGSPQRASVFDDSGFVDGWFMCFRPSEHSIGTSFAAGSKAVFLCIYPLLFAAGHAWTIYLLVVGARIYRADRNGALGVSLGLWALPFIAVAMILGSHWQFRDGGDNPNWLQPVVVVMAIVILLVLVFG